MESTSAAFWCYNCEKQFEAPAQSEACVVCSCSAIELIDTATQSNLPSSFQVYQIPTNNKQPTINTQSQQNMPNIQPFPINFTQAVFQFGMPPLQTLNAPFSPMAPNIFTIAESFAQSLLSPNGGIINLIESLAGQRGLTPASNVEINQLQKVDRVKECSICQEEDTNSSSPDKKGLKLKCGHMFHLDCIGPWFERTNTCPSCRVRI